MLHSRCVLLLGFTFVGHECLDLLSPLMECMYAQTETQFMLSAERLSWSGVRTYVKSKGNMPSNSWLGTGSNM